MCGVTLEQCPLSHTGCPGHPCIYNIISRLTGDHHRSTWSHLHISITNGGMLYHTRRFNEVECGYTGFTLPARPSVRPSVDGIVSTLYLPQHSPDPFRFYRFYQPTSGVASWFFLIPKFVNFYQLFYFRLLNPTMTYDSTHNPGLGLRIFFYQTVVCLTILFSAWSRFDWWKLNSSNVCMVRKMPTISKDQQLYSFTRDKLSCWMTRWLDKCHASQYKASLITHHSNTQWYTAVPSIITTDTS